MKVFFINTVDKRGSTGRIVRQLGDALEKQGDQYRIAFGRGDATDFHAYRIGNNVDLYAHAFLSRITDRAGFYSKNATRKLIREIQQFKPDIVHLHNLHGYYVHLPTLFNYLKTEYKGKIVWTLHDCWSFTGHCVHYTMAKCGKWQTGCSQCPQKREFPASLILDSSKRNYQEKRNLFTGIQGLTIVTPSAWLAGEIKKSFLSNYEVKVINNAVDLSIFRIKDGIEKKRHLLLNVADGYDKKKGFDDLVALSKMLPKGYKIRIVGVDKKHMNLGNDKLELMPRTENLEALVDAYNEAGFFINPTYEDNFPTVNMEAIACGTPVITYKVGGSPEVITEKTGMVVLAGDVTGIKEAVIAGRYFADSCREQAVSFGLDSFVRKHLELYQSIKM